MALPPLCSIKERRRQEQLLLPHYGYNIRPEQNRTEQEIEEPHGERKDQRRTYTHRGRRAKCLLLTCNETQIISPASLSFLLSQSFRVCVTSVREGTFSLSTRCVHIELVGREEEADAQQ